MKPGRLTDPILHPRTKSDKRNRKGGCICVRNPLFSYSFSFPSFITRSRREWARNQWRETGIRRPSFFRFSSLKLFLFLFLSETNGRWIIFSGSDEEGGFDTPTKPGGSRMHVPYCIHRDRDLPTNWADQEWKLSQFPSGGCFYIRHQRIKGEQDRAWIWIKLSGKKKKKESHQMPIKPMQQWVSDALLNSHC